MASTLLGRAECPECGFKSAHVKISDKEGAKAYRHCPDCGAQYFPKNKAQADRLLAAMRPEGGPAPAPAAPAVPAATPVPEPAPAPKMKNVLGVMVPA